MKGALGFDPWEAAGLEPPPKTPPIAQPQAAFERIDPEKAMQWLLRNTENRPLRPGYVKKLARDMARGAWVTTHQGVAFDRDGVLLDGQHRLEAIAVSGRAQTLLVVRDLDPKARLVMDIGTRRTMSDLLNIKPHTAQCGILCANIAGVYRQTAGADEVGVYTTLLEPHVEALMAACPTQKKFRSSTPVRLAFALRHVEQSSETDRRALCETYRAWVLGYSEKWTPAMHGLNRQIENGMAGTHNPIDLFYRTWRALDRASATKIIVQVKKLRAGEDVRASDATILARRVVEQLGLGASQLLPDCRDDAS